MFTAESRIVLYNEGAVRSCGHHTIVFACFINRYSCFSFFSFYQNMVEKLHALGHEPEIKPQMGTPLR